MMDVFTALERKVEKLIEAYRELQTRTASLEEENARLREAAAGDTDDLKARITALEQERGELRERLEKLLSTIDAIEL
jgi:FtsZ-binding cell division protein ZapB